MTLTKNIKVRNAILIGSLCSVSYLAVYVARNILGAVSPQMVESGAFTNEDIGALSSVYLSFYAVGQLINGAIGDKVKARYMISFGLILAGVCNFVFPYIILTSTAARYIYGMTGFFLSMIYGPMTKVVAENTEPLYATRCSLGYTFSSFLGSPFAGMLAALLAWQSVFVASSGILLVMGVVCFSVFFLYEKIGIVKYNQYDKPQKERGGGIRVLLRHRIVKFTFIAILTGIVRTAVVFWMPTYFAQYLGFLPEQAATIFTAASLGISMSAFISVTLYERLKRDMDKTILVVFIASAVFFLLVYLVRQPVMNIVFIVLAIIACNCASTMLWSRYCPSLRDTGMVSGATGFLDFTSYMAASISSTLFANAATRIGWGNLILVWCGLMAVGIIVALPYERFRK